jgi:hypothetical protein
MLASIIAIKPSFTSAFQDPSTKASSQSSTDLAAVELIRCVNVVVR